MLSHHGLEPSSEADARDARKGEGPNQGFTVYDVVIAVERSQSLKEGEDVSAAQDNRVSILGAHDFKVSVLSVASSTGVPDMSPSGYVNKPCSGCDVDDKLKDL
jgi:hypothetical protein